MLVGLTGGIGSGKTTVAEAFKTLGIPVYIADDEAKALMNRSKIIKRKLIKLFGYEAYENDELNRPFIANLIFNDADLLAQINAIVHPKVAQHFKRWFTKQNAPYVLKESAILFEHGEHKTCDYTILVTAPVEVRMQRVVARDNTTPSKVEAIIKNQMSDAKKISMADFVISNNELEHTLKQVKLVHKKLLIKVDAF